MGNSISTVEEYIKAMKKKGAVLERTDMGASTWCTIHFPDEESVNVGGSFLINEKHPIELSVLELDKRGIPCKYVIKVSKEELILQ